MGILVHFWSSRRDWIHSSLRSSAESAIRQRIEDFNGSNLSERIKSTAKMPWKWFFGDFFGSLKLQIFESSTSHVFRRPVEMILEMPVFIGDFLEKRSNFVDLWICEIGVWKSVKNEWILLQNPRHFLFKTEHLKFRIFSKVDPFDLLRFFFKFWEIDSSKKKNSRKISLPEISTFLVTKSDAKNK